MNLSPAFLVAGFIVNMSTASATPDYQNVLNQLPLPPNEHTTLLHDLALHGLEQHAMAELIKGYNRLHNKRIECANVATVLKRSQLDSLKMDVEYYTTVLFYVDGLNKNQCESAEFGAFTRTVAINYVMHKSPRELKLVKAMNVLSSGRYANFIEFEAEFNALPETVKTAALKADFLRDNFNLFQSLEQVHGHE